MRTGFWHLQGPRFPPLHFLTGRIHSIFYWGSVEPEKPHVEAMQTGSVERADTASQMFSTDRKESNCISLSTAMHSGSWRRQSQGAIVTYIRQDQSLSLCSDSKVRPSPFPLPPQSQGRSIKTQLIIQVQHPLPPWLKVKHLSGWRAPWELFKELWA